MDLTGAWNYTNKLTKDFIDKGKQKIHHLVCKETRDEDVMEALQNKGDVQDALVESLKVRIKKIKEENKK